MTSIFEFRPLAAYRSLAAYRPVLLTLLSVIVQAVAATYFVVDGIDDVLDQLGKGISAAMLMECLVALALLLAVIVGARNLRRALAETRRHQVALLAARGAMNDLLQLRFKQWNLSRSEADVATFALKGCAIGEIARMRNSAEGTVRSQLSSIYAKAGVTSQPMLIAHFIEELL